MQHHMHSGPQNLVHELLKHIQCSKEHSRKGTKVEM